EAGDQAARGGLLARLDDRQDERRPGEVAPIPGTAPGHVLDTPGLLRQYHLPEGPEVRVGVTGEAGGCAPPEPAVALRQEKEAEGNIAPVAGEHFGRTVTGFVSTLSLGRFGGKFAERAEPALGENAFRRFEGNEQDAADAAVVVGDGAVGVREEGFFDEAAPVKPQGLVYRPGGFPCCKHPL